MYVENKNYIFWPINCHRTILSFGVIGSKGVFNNNPTTTQFEAAYKQSQVPTEITGPRTGNITNPEYLPILSCGSGQ